MASTYTQRKHPLIALFAGSAFSVFLFLFLSTSMPWLYAAYCAFGLFGTAFFAAYLLGGRENIANRIGILAMAAAFIAIVFLGMHDAPLSLSYLF